ncbi:MAG: hypothetical protein HGA23_01800, partial [Bacteroidales bacterium]|nr:hypothetical protein [Bacteroidales bacterium]
SISFVAGSGYISDDATLLVNTPFVVKILAESNVTSGAKIASLNITRIVNNQIVGDTTFTFNDATVTFELTIMSYPTAAVENIEFEAVDKDGQKASISLQITTQVLSAPIDSWTERLLGSWNNPTGSSFASINGNVYTLDEAFANQSLIDYMYWWGASTSATIGAPDDANAALVFNTGDYKLDNWTTKNATRFKTTTVSSAAFDAMTDANDIIDIATGADQTRIPDLAADQVIAFVTVTGKHGLLRVKSFTEGSDGTMTIDVKVEK